MKINEQILRILGVGEYNKLDDIQEGFGVYPSEREITNAIIAELHTVSPNVENALIALMYQKVFDRAKALAVENRISPEWFTTNSGYYVNALASHFFIDGENVYSWQDIKNRINEIAEEQQ